MAEFKSSRLFQKLEGMLSQDAMDFVDACMDDFEVDEYHDNEPDDYEGIWYELRGMFYGYYKGKEVSVTQIYDADLCGMAALIEHLALTHMLLIEHIDKNISDSRV